MDVDTLEQLEQAFSSFTTQTVGADPRRENLTERIALLRALCLRLRTACIRDGDNSVSAVLVTVARTEIGAIEEKVTWLSEHAAHIEEREILHQIARLSSQGWTATELLQRASA